MSDNQKTLNSSIEFTGVGLHTGEDVHMVIEPAKINHGVKFQRVDLENQPVIEADVDLVTEIERGTTLTKSGASVSTVEHVLSALTGLGIDNCLIEVSAQEMPIMDGSAQPFVKVLQEAGIKDFKIPKNYYIITEPVKYVNKEKGIDFELFENKFNVEIPGFLKLRFVNHNEANYEFISAVDGKSIWSNSKKGLGLRP